MKYSLYVILLIVVALLIMILFLYFASRVREQTIRNDVFKAISDTYYSMHLIDLDADTTECFLDDDNLKYFYGNSGSAQQMMNNVMRGVVTDEYLEAVLKFVDMRDLSWRMKDRNNINMEFIGKNHGWIRASFVSVKQVNGIQKKVMFTTKIIDEDKLKQIDLMFKSNNDDLTGLFNRRAYNEEIDKLIGKKLEKNTAVVFADLNCLKATNDTKGHAAGDELIVGAAQCLKKCFDAYGDVYRTGGDEFNCILTANDKQLENICEDLAHMIEGWKGNLNDSLSISWGYASEKDVKNFTIEELTSVAEHRMYDAKKDYYISNSIDRRKSGDTKPFDAANRRRS